MESAILGNWPFGCFGFDKLFAKNCLARPSLCDHMESAIRDLGMAIRLPCHSVTKPLFAKSGLARPLIISLWGVTMESVTVARI